MSAGSVQRIGHYRLGQNLGIGSFGKVRLAEHQLTGHKVAVKILNRGRIKQLDMDEKVRREIKILKMFYHPHIIRLYEVIYTPSDIYMVMEFVAGGELFDFIVSNGRLPEEKARRFFQQIISGVEYCHQRMVVHRDLKPENLLLDNEQNVRIADFGLSNVMVDGDFLKTSCGSPNYAAPEVISGKLYAGPEVDVWSCGVILYALLCGTLPFDDENIPNLFKKIKGGIFTLPGHMSEQVKHLISCMLVVDPLKRITIPQIRQHDWFKQSLPPYLSVTPDTIIQQFKNIDFEVLDEVVMKIGFDRDHVLDALQNREHNQMSVAYYLILDHKRRKQLHEHGSVPGGALEAQMKHLKIDGKGPKQHVAETGVVGIHQPETDDRRGRRWHLGITSNGAPAQMMMEIFRALRVLNFEWKIVSQYQLKCRLAQKSSSITDASVSTIRPNLVGAKVKIGLQLYKMAEETYLLDIRKLEGETFPFMDACSALLNELQL